MGKVGRCPKCKKILALVFPVHDCKSKAVEKSMTTGQFKDLVQDLLLKGWKLGTPSPEIFLSADKACHNLVCTACGNKNLTFFPLTGQPPTEPGSTGEAYRAFAVCTGCARVIEMQPINNGGNHEHEHF